MCNVLVRKVSFNVCKDILHAGEGIMRGVTKALSYDKEKYKQQTTFQHML